MRGKIIGNYFMYDVFSLISVRILLIKTIRLFALDFYEAIADSAFDLINS